MKHQANCLLVGAGQLGSRYLQGLVGVQRELVVFVVEPSSAALDLARQRLLEIPPSASVEVRLATSLDSIPHELDVAIVATPAHCRPDIVLEMAAAHKVNAWILEKLLAQSSHQLDQIVGRLEGHNQVWVNTPRRLMVWHKLIKDQLLKSGKSLKVRSSGGDWGLACNAIHFIDLVSWWTGSQVLNIDWQGLGGWKPSKRSGYMEVFGTLIVNYQNGSSLELCCDQGNSNLQIEAVTPEGIWTIIEAEGKAIDPSGHKFPGELSFQSALTAPLVNNILSHGQCDLPSLVDSAAQHRPLLDALLQHWNESQGVQDLVVPIT